MEFSHKDLTDRIIKCFYDVYNELGYGFLEKVYQNALREELGLQGLKVETNKKIKVHYKGKVVGTYFADLIVENTVILELKTTAFHENHTLQLYNYLKSTEVEIGLLLSFAKTPKVSRRVFSNKIK